MFKKQFKDDSKFKSALINPLLKKMAKAFSITFQRGIGYTYQQVIPQMKQQAWATFEKGQDFKTDFHTISECSAYYGALVGKQYLTMKQAWQEAVERQCKYYDKQGQKRQITSVSQLRKAWDNINQRSEQDKYGLK